MQKHVNLVDLVKSFPTNIFLQKFGVDTEENEPIKFAHLAEKSADGSISNLSTKARGARRARRARASRWTRKGGSRPRGKGGSRRLRPSC